MSRRESREAGYLIQIAVNFMIFDARPVRAFFCARGKRTHDHPEPTSSRRGGDRPSGVKLGMVMGVFFINSWRQQMKDPEPTLHLLGLLLGKRTAKRLATRPLSELFLGEDVPDDVRARLSAARELVRRYSLENVRRGPVLSNPAAAREFLCLHYAGQEREVFGVMFLDNRHCLIRFDEVFLGTVDGASVHPREVVKLALARNAAAVILAHNHPSGVAEPSQADELITTRIREALALVDIRVLDHLIVGGNAVVSLAERGLL